MRGAFEVLDLFTQFHGTIHAHMSCQMSRKVYDISKHFPGTLEFKLLSRESVWPKKFKYNGPTNDYISLYFMCEVESHVKHSLLNNATNNLVHECSFQVPFLSAEARRMPRPFHAQESTGEEECP
ncbi:hypothetical protein KSP40_PGU000251 [Platanthera guangdongensis]|uniref:AIPP2-like SPOC-like domain-containing protein n=1 Tax=Platanthera guangdongensis TaxID=2320717 RepID=A0ABR2LVF3_9ASPA